MRVVIAGGTGLIGRALARALLARGDEVFLLSRDPHRVTDLPAGAQIRRWDAVTPQGWADLVTGDTGIVNLAGDGVASGRWTPDRKRRIRDSRVNAGKAIVATVAAATDKPKVLLQASAVGYYGPHGHQVVTEETPPGSDFLAGVCVDWESSTVAVEALGVRRPVIRTGVVLSRRGGALPRMLLPFRLYVGGPIGTGQQEISWIHLADEVAAILFLLDNEAASGPFILAAPEPLTNAALGRTIGNILGRTSFVPIPEWFVRLAFGEMATVLLDGQRAVPARLLGLGYRFRFSAALPALNDLLA
jgi:uncharacterized protein (TIGR01777 family)